MKKATGIVRRVDELGRIVLPIELRRVLGIQEKDKLEIYTEGDTIILHKYAPGCVFCGNTDAKEVFGDPKAKVRRYIIWGVEDGIVCASFIGGIALAGWVFHVIFTALGVA